MNKRRPKYFKGELYIVIINVNNILADNLQYKNAYMSLIRKGFIYKNRNYYLFYE